jgi:hypothetical protein
LIHSSRSTECQMSKTAVAAGCWTAGNRPGLIHTRRELNVKCQCFYLCTTAITTLKLFHHGFFIFNLARPSWPIMQNESFSYRFFTMSDRILMANRWQLSNYCQTKKSSVGCKKKRELFFTFLQFSHSVKPS